jgi:hypothetical protein
MRTLACVELSQKVDARITSFAMSSHERSRSNARGTAGGGRSWLRLTRRATQDGDAEAGSLPHRGV